jgi:exopolyphosphatase/guanosine-5'-triphosphate,3'-diphosphate pyrophosphatase
VAFVSEQLFTNLREQLGLKKDTLLYLLLAAYLHDIGMFIHNRGHDKHSEYIISSLNLFRLSDAEINMIACIARYHRKSYPNETHPLYNSLPHDKQIIVQKLSSILRLANALDRSHMQKIKKIEVKVSANQDVTLTVQVSGNFILEQENFVDKKELYEEITGNKVHLIVKNLVSL